MAEVIVRSSLNPHKAVRFNISLKKFYSKSAEAEEKYFLEVGTTHSGIYSEEDTTTYSGTDGVRIRPYYLDSIENKDLDEEISNVLGYLSSYIDWNEIYKDTTAPYMAHMEPVGEDVPIEADIKFTVADNIPTTGIDLSEMQVIFDNGTVEFDITSEVVTHGDPFEYSFLWSPPLRVR